MAGFINPRLKDFIRFCIARRGVDWPALYDEMAMVVSQRLYKGLGRSELRQLGLSLGLDSLEDTLRLIDEVISQEPKSGFSRLSDEPRTIKGFRS